VNAACQGLAPGGVAVQDNGSVSDLAAILAEWI